jgi:hypothetical protein
VALSHELMEIVFVLRHSGRIFVVFFVRRFRFIFFPEETLPLIIFSLLLRRAVIVIVGIHRLFFLGPYLKFHFVEVGSGYKKQILIIIIKYGIFFTLLFSCIKYRQRTLKF